MDCRALPSGKPRNDRNLNELAKDSRICDEKCGLQGQSQRSYLSGNDCSDCPPLPHLSQKAKSTSQNPTPNQTKGAVMSIIKELWAFLKERKKFWLFPVIVVMLFLGALIVLAKGSAVAPFIYTIF